VGDYVPNAHEYAKRFWLPVTRIADIADYGGSSMHKARHSAIGCKFPGYPQSSCLVLCEIQNNASQVRRKSKKTDKDLQDSHAFTSSAQQAVL
jgi:hypothetical protein